MIFAEKNDHSTEWAQTQETIKTAANEKRSEATKQQPRDGNRLAKKGPVRAQVVPVPQRKPEQEAKAALSHTNRGAVARGDKLRAQRPDLVQQVIHGEITSTEAHRQLRKDKIAEVVPELPTSKYKVIYADPPWFYGNSGVIGDSDNYGRAERLLSP